MTALLPHLQSTDIFSCLSTGELEDLASSARTLDLESGQAAVSQGDGGSSLFIVSKGRLSVFIDDAGSSVYVGDLWEGEFFGEMSLLTGTPRTATVKAAQSATIIEVTKSALAPLMASHTELASMMGRALSERQSSNLKTLMEFQPEQQRFEQERSAAQFTFRIKDFFEVPTNVWSKAVDGIGSFSFGGPLGAILGKSNDKTSPKNASQTSGTSTADQGLDEDKQIFFTTAVITLAAKMAAAGGSYAQKEVAQLRALYNIPAGDMANVTRLFNRAQGSARGYEPYARQVASVFQDQPALLEELIVSLFKIASSAPTGQAAMITFIGTLSDLFGFTADGFERLKSMGLSGGGGGVEGENAGPHYLTVLALTDGATAQQAKRAYHKLAMENHPDKLIAQGMPEEFIAQANEKLALINLAYEQFQAAHENQ